MKDCGYNRIRRVRKGFWNVLELELMERDSATVAIHGVGVDVLEGVM